MGKMKCKFRDKMSDTHHDYVRDEEGQSSIIKQPPNVNSACKNTLHWMGFEIASTLPVLRLFSLNCWIAVTTLLSSLSESTWVTKVL